MGGRFLMVVWAVGVAIIYAFIMGTMAESGDEVTTSQWSAIIVLAVWSLACAAYGIGNRHGKQKR